ncbi:MAG: metal ABC transporter ATP-binding protein [Chloroflexota bacterium]
MINHPHRLEVENVTVAYGDKVILNDLSFNVPYGARIAVVGPNGAGKSTLFKALVGLLPLRSGRIMIHGIALGNHKDCVAYIPQREEVDWRFPVTVRDVVMMGRYNSRGWFSRVDNADKTAVSRSLDEMGITSLAASSISDLSGGQQQRVFLARALAQDPHILLMDEPFTGVDIRTQEATIALLDRLRDRKVTSIISTHDLNLAATHFDAVLLLNRKLVAYGSSAEVLQQENLLKAFGSSLLVMDTGTMLVDECCNGEQHVHQSDADGLYE